VTRVAYLPGRSWLDDARLASESTRTFAEDLMAQRDPCTVGPTIAIRGVVRGDRSLVIHGHVAGEIHLDGQLTIEASGRVEASVYVAQLVVHGNLTGDVVAPGGVEIASGGRVSGDVTTGRLTIQDGAVFRGKVDMDVGGHARTEES